MTTTDTEARIYHLEEAVRHLDRNLTDLTQLLADLVARPQPVSPPVPGLNRDEALAAGQGATVVLVVVAGGGWSPPPSTTTPLAPAGWAKVRSNDFNRSPPSTHARNTASNRSSPSTNARSNDFNRSDNPNYCV